MLASCLPGAGLPAQDRCHWRFDVQRCRFSVKSSDMMPPPGPLSDRRIGGLRSEGSRIRLPHSAFRGQTPDAMYFGPGHGVPADLEARRKTAHAARTAVNRTRSYRVCREPVSDQASPVHTETRWPGLPRTQVGGVPSDGVRDVLTRARLVCKRIGHNQIQISRCGRGGCRRGILQRSADCGET